MSLKLAKVFPEAQEKQEKILLQRSIKIDYGNEKEESLSLEEDQFRWIQRYEQLLGGNSICDARDLLPYDSSITECLSDCGCKSECGCRSDCGCRRDCGCRKNKR